MRARFLRETKVTARLDHPGVVTVHDLGTRDGGDPFYVMHLVRGEDLRKAIRRLHGLDRPRVDDDPAGGTRAGPRPGSTCTPWSAGWSTPATPWPTPTAAR